MASELISKVLSPTNATYINGVSAERRFAAAVLENMYQGLVEKNGRGINDKFVTEDDATSSAQVFVNRVLPVNMQPREQGATKNGASFSANSHYTQTETVGIELLQVLDDTIIIPRARQDMIKVDLLAEQTKIYSDRLTTIINGATFASKVLKSWLEESLGNEINKKIITISGADSDVEKKLVLHKFIEANSLLDEGDEAHGIDLFPEDTRVCVVKPSYRAILKTSGILVIGGANYGYDIAKGDAISHADSARKSEDGYIGEIDGVPCHIISNQSLGHAEGFLGFKAGELKACPLFGYIASSYANARGVSTAKRTKVVDAISGQGLVLQPYTKFGVVSWYAKGNVLLLNAEYNPFTSLRSLLSAEDLAKVTFKLKGAGSRLYPVISLPTATSSGATVSASASDDWGTGHIVAGLYYVSTTAPKTVGEFATAYASAADKGALTVTSGDIASQSISETVASNSYVNVLVISDDGSFDFKSAQYVA